MVAGKFVTIRSRDPPENFMKNKKVPKNLPDNSGPYDSVYANYSATKYKEYVVYKGHQAYPEFVIEFRRRP